MTSAFARLGAALVVLVGCGQRSPTTSSTEKVSSAIIGGTVDTTTTATFTLVARSPSPDGNDSLCTGTAIAPHVMLTAAHCIDAAHLRKALGGDYAQYIITGDYEPGAKLPAPDSIEVQEVHLQPGYAFGSIYTKGHDVGLIVTKDVLPRAPLKLVRALDERIIGTSVRLVGAGLTDPTNLATIGKRHSITAEIDGLDDTWFWTRSDKPTTCHGDSGGPTLRGKEGDEVILGVHSYGDPGDCSGASYEARVDGPAVTELITSVVA